MNDTVAAAPPPPGEDPVSIMTRRLGYSMEEALTVSAAMAIRHACSPTHTHTIHLTPLNDCWWAFCASQIPADVAAIIVETGVVRPRAGVPRAWLQREVRLGGPKRARGGGGEEVDMQAEEEEEAVDPWARPRGRRPAAREYTGWASGAWESAEDEDEEGYDDAYRPSPRRKGSG
jgi:hypothetical protein